MMFGLPRLYIIAGGAVLAAAVLGLAYWQGWQASAAKDALERLQGYIETMGIINDEKANDTDPADLDDSLRELAE